MTVEINKRECAPKTVEVLRRDSHRSEHIAQDLDEIVTEKTEDLEEVVVPRISVPEPSAKEKGFSIQRAWCCLRSRRTS